jgi:hypothetical protein
MEDKLVTIAEYMDSMKAEMAKQVLEDFDIKAVIVGENAVNTCLAPTVMTAKLQVLESNADEAKQILEDQEQSFEPEESLEFKELGGYEEPEEQ